MNKLTIIALITMLGACGKRVERIPGETITVEVPGPTVEVPVEVLVPVYPPAAPPVTCQVFKNWNVTTLPTTHQVKGDIEIGLQSMTLTPQDNDLLPFNEFLGTDASLVTNSFALRCNFKFEVTNIGNHVFTLESDDGSELYVNGSRIINNGGAHGMLIKTGTVNLPLGIHDMQVRYYEGNGPKGLNLSVQRPVISTTPPPQSL